MDIIFKIIGALGLGLIIIGILKKERKAQDIFYALGGALLEIYSISIGDIIFIILQATFTLAAIYDFYKLVKSKRTTK